MTREERWRCAVDRYFAPAGMALADQEIAEALAASAAVREGERERLAAALALCDEWDALAARQGDWNDDRRDRADAMGHAADALRAILAAPSLAAPEGTEQ